MVFPKEVGEGAVFVYGREQCRCPPDKSGDKKRKRLDGAEGDGDDDNNDDDDDDDDDDGDDDDDDDEGHKKLYMKPLNKVYEAFPLWSPSSTVIFDDDAAKVEGKADNFVVVGEGEVANAVADLKAYVVGGGKDVREWVRSWRDSKRT